MTASHTHSTLAYQRRQIAPLLNEASPADALAAYYALHHDVQRTQLHLVHAASGRTTGFLAVCRTGMDLFRPLAVLRAGAAEPVLALLRAGLAPGRASFLFAPPALREWIAAAAALSDETIYRVYTVEPREFKPVINILVQREATPDGAPRWIVRAQDGTAAAVAGYNWRSPHWAEIYVHVEPGARGRGLGRSVVSAATAWLAAQGQRPLYLAAEHNTHSLSLAEALGYRDTQAREWMAQAILRETT